MKIYTWLAEQAMKQGFAVFLLVIAVIYFQNRLDKVQNELFKNLIEDREEALKMVNQNTIALERNTKVMERIEAHWR